VASGTLSEATTLGARAVVSAEPGDATPEVRCEALDAGVDELLVALTSTMVAMIASTMATGASAATTGCLERKRFGLAVAGLSVAPAVSWREPVDAAGLGDVDRLGVGRRVDGTRRLVDFDISFS